MIEFAPPWLRRVVGGAIMESLGVPVETEVDRTTEGVELRFPTGNDGATIHSDALGYLGRERRILRGPGESATTFANRLRAWWDSHLTRGGPYALLGQLHAFFLESNNVPIQYIANSGTEVTIAADGTTTRGSVAGWLGDGEIPPKWARFWIVFYFDGGTLEVGLTAEDGEPILTEDGLPVLVGIDLFSLGPAEIDLLCSVPREWSAAHIDRIYLVLIPLDGYAWGLPPGIAWGDVGKTWGGGLTPAVITC